MQRDLVERARDGDHDAFADLARKSSDRMFALASLILADAEAAKDALQEALILAWRDIRGLREPVAWEASSNRLTVRAWYRRPLVAGWHEAGILVVRLRWRPGRSRGGPGHGAEPDKHVGLGRARRCVGARRVLQSDVVWSSTCGVDLSWSADSRHLAVSHSDPPT